MGGRRLPRRSARAGPPARGLLRGVYFASVPERSAGLGGRSRLARPTPQQRERRAPVPDNSWRPHAAVERQFPAVQPGAVGRFRRRIAVQNSLAYARKFCRAANKFRQAATGVGHPGAVGRGLGRGVYFAAAPERSGPAWKAVHGWRGRRPGGLNAAHQPPTTWEPPLARGSVLRPRPPPGPAWRRPSIR
jgi:hypothetical protein